jgi:DNA-binding HxlR family transcriptional regulator
MRWNEIGAVRCSIARSLAVVGDRWTLLLVRECFRGTRRFEDFCVTTGAARHIVAERLDALVAADVLERRPYSQHPERFEYRLTEKGRDLYPVIISLMAWGDRWAGDEHGPPVTLTHAACGEPVTPELVCPVCHEPVDARVMRATDNVVDGQP